MATSVSLLTALPQTEVSALATTVRRPIVMVVGMHRSGTSLCSHVLSALGVDMADQVPGHPDNPKGHWERWEIVNSHDRILEFFNRGYYNPLHDFGLPIAWWADPSVGEVRREIACFLEKRMGDSLFGFKDPRTVLLIPMWHQIASDLRLAPKIIYCLRSPAQVARSIHVRDGVSLDLAEYRWLSYNIDFFRYLKASKFCTIEYETWFNDPVTNLTKLRRFLDLPAYDREFDIDVAIAEIIDDELRHDDDRRREARQPLIRTVYRLARQADRDPATRERIQSIAAQFGTFQQLQRAFAGREAELAANLEQQRTQIADLTRKGNEAEAAVWTAQSDIAELHKRLGDAERQAEERETATVALQDENSGLREALAQTQHESQERGAFVEMLRGQLAVMTGELRTLGQRVSDAELWAADLVAARGELASAYTEVSRELEASQAAAAASRVEFEAETKTLRGEIAALRDELAVTTRELQERGAASEALRNQVLDLSTALSAAREVGRFAISALGTVGGIVGASAPVNSNPKVGWPNPLVRFLKYCVGRGRDPRGGKFAAIPNH